MLVFFNDEQALHAPVHEIFRGERVPCFENPSRADFVRTSLLALLPVYEFILWDPS